MRIPYRAALRYREFRYLISGRFISQLGNQASVPVLGFAVLEIGGGAVDIGVVLGAEAAAVAVFLVVGGVVTDMWPRRKIMIAADLIRLGSQGLTATLGA